MKDRWHRTNDSRGNKNSKFCNEFLWTPENTICHHIRFAVLHFYILHLCKRNRNPSIMRFHCHDGFPVRVSRIDRGHTAHQFAFLMKRHSHPMIRNTEHITVDEFRNFLILGSALSAIVPSFTGSPRLIFKSTRLLGR